MKEIYFDNAATTRCTDSAVDLMTKILLEDYGNPSSLHRKGMEAENYIKDTTEILARTLKVDKNTIFYTSGGSESSNTAIFGIAATYKKRGNHIITTVMEHPATSSPIGYLEDSGFEVTYLEIDEHGQIDLEQLKEHIRPETILVSIMHVNNEMGSIQPIEEIGRIIKACNPQTVFHVDGIQSYGKVDLFPKKAKIDLLSMSSHKIHGPKGVGVLYIRKGLNVSPLILGGGHQKGMRSGTENVPGVAGLGEAIKEIFKDISSNRAYLYDLKNYFWEKLNHEIEDVFLNGPDILEGAPHIINVRVGGVRSEVLLHALEDEGIYVSSGSACSSNKPEIKSPSLYGLGLTRTEIDESVRFSFSTQNTKAEIDESIEKMKKTIAILRKFKRR